MSDTTSLTIGRSCSLVVLVAGLRVDLTNVEGFGATQETRKFPAWPLNQSAPVELVLTAGWRGQFDVARSGPAVDDLFAEIDRAQRLGLFVMGAPAQGGHGSYAATIYQFVSEPDGSTSTYEFAGASLSLPDAGRYRASDVVRQTVAFFASTRTRL